MILAAGIGAAVWLIAGVVLAPVFGAIVARRPMTHPEREALAWGGLAVALGLFLMALLVIGARS